MPERTAHVGVWEKIAYGLGDTATNLVWRTLLVFLLNFYTDVFGLTAAAANIVFAFYPLNDSLVQAISRDLELKRGTTT